MFPGPIHSQVCIFPSEPCSWDPAFLFYLSRPVHTQVSIVPQGYTFTGCYMIPRTILSRVSIFPRDTRTQNPIIQVLYIPNGYTFPGLHFLK